MIGAYFSGMKLFSVFLCTSRNAFPISEEPLQRSKLRMPESFEQSLRLSSWELATDLLGFQWKWETLETGRLNSLPIKQRSNQTSACFWSWRLRRCTVVRFCWSGECFEFETFKLFWERANSAGCPAGWSNRAVHWFQNIFYYFNI